jgi:hypothetical protein
MFSKKELKLVIGLAICLLAVGVVSYTAFSAKDPELPVRVMYRVAAGKVLFDHQMHSAESGYGFSCFDCHHHPPEDDMALRACGDCHTQTELPVVENEACLECHDAEDIEDSEMPQRGDAYHGQCVVCHQDFEAGPVECSECHVMD